MVEKAPTHLSLIFIGTALSAFSLGSIVAFTNPASTGTVTHIMFFTSLFLTSLGLFTLLGIIIRRKLQPGLYVTHVSLSFRQALFVALFITGSLALRVNGLLYWWVLACLLLFLIATEIFLNL